MTWRLFAVFFALAGVHGSQVPVRAGTGMAPDGKDATLSALFDGQGISLGASDSGVATGEFSIHAAADVSLALVLDYSALGSSCGHEGCYSDWTFTGGFQGTAEIVGPGGVIDLTVPFSGSGSSAPSCDPISGQCMGGVSLTADAQGAVDLAAGSYMVVVTYSDQNDSVGDWWSQGTLGVTLADPVASVPEPRLTALMIVGLAMIAGGIFGLIRRNHQPVPMFH